jgi:hypothetical protein
MIVLNFLFFFFIVGLLYKLGTKLITIGIPLVIASPFLLAWWHIYAPVAIFKNKEVPVRFRVLMGFLWLFTMAFWTACIHFSFQS